MCIVLFLFCIGACGVVTHEGKRIETSFYFLIHCTGLGEISKSQRIFSIHVELIIETSSKVLGGKNLSKNSVKPLSLDMGI